MPGPAELRMAQAMPPRDALFGAAENVAPSEAAGRIAAEMTTPYPPGIPAVLPGERLTEPAPRCLSTGLAAGMNLPDPTDPELRTIRVVAQDTALRVKQVTGPGFEYTKSPRMVYGSFIPGERGRSHSSSVHHLLPPWLVSPSSQGFSMPSWPSRRKCGPPRCPGRRQRLKWEGEAPLPIVGEELRAMTKATKLLTALPPPQRQHLMTLAREVSFPEDARIFDAGGTADRFWVIRSGAVSLVQQVTSLRRVTVASLGAGDLLGWSWLFPPYRWDFGAEAFSPVRAYEFEASPVLALCDEDPALGMSLIRIVAEILAHRLETTRGKLMEQYGTHRRGEL